MFTGGFARFCADFRRTVPAPNRSVHVSNCPGSLYAGRFPAIGPVRAEEPTSQTNVSMPVMAITASNSMGAKPDFIMVQRPLF